MKKLGDITDAKYIHILVGEELKQRLIKKAEEKKLSLSHARALSKITDPNKVMELAQRVIKENLSVREIEKITNNEELPKKVKINRTNNVKFNIFEKILREKIGTKVKISNRKIEIPFDSDKDLERILEIINVKIEGD